MGSSVLPVLLLVVAFASAAQLPSSLKTCKQNDPDFSGCLKKAVQDAIPVLVKGIPSLGLQPLDPLHFTQIKIQDTPERPVSLSLEFNEVDFIGIANAIVDSIEMKPGSYLHKAYLKFDAPFSVVGPYKADGKVLVLPIKGEGNSNIILHRLEVVTEMTGQPVERDGETYWDIADYKVDLKFQNVSIDLTGLYKNDKTLADSTLKFLNENSVEVVKELEPAIEEALSLSFKEMARRVFGKVPYKSVFPPS